MWRTLAPASAGLCLAVLLSTSGTAAGGEQPDAKKQSAEKETAAEKLRKKLDQVRDLEIAEQALDSAVAQLRELTGLNLVIDRAAVALPAQQPAMLGGAAPQQVAVGPYAHLRVGGHSHGLPLRAALTKLLRDHNLTHVLVGDTVLITTTDQAATRQLHQPVSVHAENTPLADVLKKLSRETGANVVLDPRAAKEGRTALTVRLDEVPLETAVEVLADEAGLQVARLSNVLYVTSEARAEKLRKPAPVAPADSYRVWPDGLGGYRLYPPTGGGNLIGFTGFSVMGGVGGLGVGGGMGGVPRRGNPNPPQPPAAQPPAPPRETTPAKPAVKPDDGKGKPAPRDREQRQAIRPPGRSPRSRRGQR